MTQFTELQEKQFGLVESHLIEVQQGERIFMMVRQAAEALGLLQAAAGKAGFDLQLVSAYRSFERQHQIFTAKAEGRRPLLDDNGVELAFDRLSDAQRLRAIMRWSAVPGLSRHHWGTDVDVFDANTMALQDVQLVPAEVDDGGPSAAMHDWLDERIANNASYGFFRPYQFDRGAIAPERWHLSYLPAAAELQCQMDRDIALNLWQGESVPFCDILASRLDDIWERFVTVAPEGHPEWVKAALLV
ncbi:Putative carboxypeptidase YodJ [BD1-7 clade bacterium]|uniref:Carboxypeptidase YodJ n=1 Tax=BD1-7 clade bacterium TaxID=2029982 RepID=A0A5S9N784_9GAMM|nr:Putative carboxypeptidase YodJ [BD1-7 clade bacterium]CAA0085194.1 Putative carboxypeptidase YodJ [BD1-7 clade bacterium]